MRREIIVIDEERCDGCGLCVPACHEGALEIVHGKAKLVAEPLCDGLGACLGECPSGALQVVVRDAEAFDEEAVERRREDMGSHGPFPRILADSGAHACPSQRFVSLGQPSSTATEGRNTPSELTHWPVQLRLLPPTAPVFRGASLLLSADCVAVAFPDFHPKLLRGRVVAVACPKLDDGGAHLEKLAGILRDNDVREITVAHMEVPCCSGLLALVLEAQRLSGTSVPVAEVIIGTRGEILRERELHLGVPMRAGV